MNKRIAKFAAILSGFVAALLVAGFVVFAPNTATAGDCDAYGNCADDGIIEGGQTVVGAGSGFVVDLFAAPGEEVTLTVTIPGAGIPTITLAGTASLTTVANDEGVARFNVSVPTGTPAGTVSLVGTNGVGAVIFTGSLVIPGAGEAPQATPEVRHPAAG